MDGGLGERMTLMERRRALMAGTKSEDDGNLIVNFEPISRTFAWGQSLVLQMSKPGIPGDTYRVVIDATVDDDARILAFVSSANALPWTFSYGQNGEETVTQEYVRSAASTTKFYIFVRPATNDGVARSATIRSVKVYKEAT